MSLWHHFQTWGLCTIVLGLASAHAATIRTVHNASPCPGDGSDAAPYCTIQAAVDAAQCGDVLRLRPGAQPYSEQVTITQPACPPETPIFLEPERQQEIRWVPKRSPGNDVYGLKLQDVDGWVVRGLTFAGSPEQPRYALIVQARTRSVAHLQVLGNRFLDWNLATRYANAAPLLVSGDLRGGHGVLGARVVGNTVAGFRGRALTVSHSRNGYYGYNDIGGGVCGPATPGATVYTKLEAVHTHTTDPSSLAQAAGDIWEYNAIHDLETPAACMAQTGQSEKMTVHAWWCDVGHSDGTFRFNRVWNIAKGAPGNVRTVRFEARCHRWAVHDNHLWDVGGGGFWLNGFNFDTTFARNRIERPGYACVVLGGDEPRRVVVRDNTCLEAPKALWPYAGFTDAQMTQDGNSWQTPAP